jgi:predicted permease
MDALHRLVSLFRNLLRRRRIDDDLDAEVRGYADMLAEEKIEAGMDPGRARREARLALGGVEQVKEEVRAVRAGALIEQLAQDVRYGLRGLRRAPAFTAAVVVTLALGIGANTATFSVIDALLLRPLPVSEPDRLVAIYRGPSGTVGAFSYPDLVDVAQQHVLAGVSAWGTHSAWARLGGDVERMTVHLVSPNYFSVLGAPPQLGTGFPEHSEVAAQGTVVISNRLWRSRFAADPAIAGRAISIKGQVMTIVGVGAPGFEGLDPSAPADAWLPLASLALLEPEWNFRERNEIWLRLIARLRAGTTARAAERALGPVAQRIAEGAPPQFASSLRLVPAATPLFDPEARDTSARMALLVAGVSAFVLLIACANVASLMIVRAAARRREMGVRLAIGASRGRVGRQVITESLLLAAAGCAGGLLVAYGTIEAIVALAPASTLPRGIAVSLDGRVALFAVAASIGTAVLFGVWPALQASRVELLPVLKGGSQAEGSGRGVMGLRQGLVVAQVALSVVLLIGAALFVRTMSAALAVEPGYEIDRVMLTAVDFTATPLAPADRPAAGARIVEAVRALSGIEAAALGQIVPFSGAFVMRPAAPEGVDVSPANEDQFLVPYNVVSDDYFRTLGVPLRGREFGDADSGTSPKVAIVNETLARKYWPGQDALGKRMTLPLPKGAGPAIEVIGIVADGRYVSLTETQHPYMYFPLSQMPRPRVTLHVRTAGDPLAMAPAIRDAIRSVNADLPADRPASLRALVDRSVAAQRAAARLLTLVGAIALAVAAVGVYGLTAYTVMRRSKEIGVRVALGARPVDLLWMLVSQSAWLVAAGLAIGAAGAIILTGLVRSLLFGVTASDPVSFLAGGGLLVVTTMAATLIPARRAMRASPLAALRMD